MSIDDTIACIHSQQWIAVVAHPFCVTCGKILYIGNTVSPFRFDGVEVFNSQESFSSKAKALALAQSLGLLQFARSDAYDLHFLGYSRITLFGDKTFDYREIVFRMKLGQFCIVSSRFYSGDGSFVLLRSSVFSFFYRCLSGCAL